MLEIQPDSFDKLIPFNVPFLSGKEFEFMNDALAEGKISGNGKYTKLCQEFFEDKFKFKRSLLTTSCTDALEMSSILGEIKPGDEVILPSYTFVSTANAFVLRGAKLIFADSYKRHPNIDPDQISKLITNKTKAIIVVHYAGVACDMDPIMNIAKEHNILVIEDAAQAIDSYYKGVPLGSFGEFSAFSFHETKNIICGEGGLLVVNDEKYIQRSEIIWEKGTNRSAFFRGEIDKYGWVDIGSSFLPSDILASFLYAQLNALESIQNKRKAIWQIYYDKLMDKSEKVLLPEIPHYATNNAHMFYLVFSDLNERSDFIKYMRSKNVHAVFHYLSLHKSQFYADKHTSGELPNCDYFANGLVRLPLYCGMSLEDAEKIADIANSFFD